MIFYPPAHRLPFQKIPLAAGQLSSRPAHAMCGCNTKCGMFVFSAFTVVLAVFAICGVGGNKFDWTRIRIEVDTPLGDPTAWAYFGLTKFSGSVGFTNANANMLGALPKLTGTSALPASEEGADRRYGQECPAGSGRYCPDSSYICESPPFGYICPDDSSECCFSSPTPTPTPTPSDSRRRSYPSPTPTPPSSGIWISYSDCADLSDECKICDQSGKASLAFSCIAAVGALLGSLIVLSRCHHESVSSAYTVVATLTLVAALVGWLAWFACFAQLVNSIADVNASVAIFPTTGSWAMALTFIVTAALTCAEKKRLRMVRCNRSSDRERLVVVVPPVTTSAVVVSQPYSNVPSQATTSGTTSFLPPPPPPPQYDKVVPAWTEFTDEGGNVYYHNAETNATTWERPEM